MNLFPNTIINFHSVYNQEWMGRVLLLLKKSYNIVPISEIEKYYYEGTSLKNACHITFDDGDISFYKIVYPLLQKHHIPVSVYVSPLSAIKRKNFWFQEIYDYDQEKLLQIIETNFFFHNQIKKNTPLNALFKSMTIDTIWKVIRQYWEDTGTLPKPCINMEPNQLLELHQSGLVSIGAHTLNHPILKNEDILTVKHEIKKSIELLSEMLSTRIKYFAYPNGTPHIDFGKREMDILRNAGVKIAFSTENKSFCKKDNPLSIPRNGLSKGNHFFILTKLISGSKWDIIKKLFKGKQENDFRL